MKRYERTRLRWFGWHRGNVLTPSSLVGAGWETKRECAAAMEAAYGYLRERPDLTSAPHFWNIPKPVRCRVVVTTLKPVTGIILR